MIIIKKLKGKNKKIIIIVIIKQEIGTNICSKNCIYSHMGKNCVWDDTEDLV